MAAGKAHLASVLLGLNPLSEGQIQCIMDKVTLADTRCAANCRMHSLLEIPYQEELDYLPNGQNLSD